MGNKIDIETEFNMVKTMNQIFNEIDQSIDIKNKNGLTGYLDFFTPEYLEVNGVKHNVVKGIDSAGRKFILIKTEFVFADNTTTPTLSCIFQRYTDNKFLFCCCSHYTTEMMETGGGMDINQMKFLHELVFLQSVKINFEMIRKLRILCYPCHPFAETEKVNHNLVPIKLRVGWTREPNITQNCSN